jgi:hypothetical protein
MRNPPMLLYLDFDLFERVIVSFRFAERLLFRVELI